MIKILEKHNIITHADVAAKHVDELLPHVRQFIHTLTTTINPDDYKGQLNEFIEIVIGIMSYTSGSLIVALSDMFPDVPVNTFTKNFKKSLESSIDLQLRQAMGIQSC